MLRELNQRKSEGVVVSLLWDDQSDMLSVVCSDSRTGTKTSFEVPDKADRRVAFEHPFAYASSGCAAQLITSAA